MASAQLPQEDVWEVLERFARDINRCKKNYCRQLTLKAVRDCLKAAHAAGDLVDSPVPIGIRSWFTHHLAVMLAIQDSQLAHAALQLRVGSNAPPEADVLLEGTEAGIAAQEATIRSLVAEAGPQPRGVVVAPDERDVGLLAEVVEHAVAPRPPVPAVAADD